MEPVPELPPRPYEFAAGRLSIRSAARADAAWMHAAVQESGAELAASMTWWRPDMTEAAMDQWLAYCESSWDDGSHFEFSVGAPDAPFLASAGVGPVHWPTLTANLSYWVRTSHTGRGIGSTCCRAVARWACLRLGLTRVEIVVATGNPASQRVAARAGASREGVLRNKLRWANRPHDAVVFSFIPADFVD